MHDLEGIAENSVADGARRVAQDSGRRQGVRRSRRCTLDDADDIRGTLVALHAPDMWLAFAWGW